MSTSGSWSPDSWRTKTVAQPVRYPDQGHLDQVLGTIKTLPPLVTPSEIERLRHQLSAVQRGDAFLLHAGDCAESFDACTHENISAKIGLILSFSLILIWGQRLPVVRIGRIAGQYAKPRSSSYEKIGEKQVLSFRGDNVNGLDPNDRTPDPERLLRAYFYSSTTLNYVRALLGSGFASLHHPRGWSLDHVRSSSLREEFKKVTEGLQDALDFSQTIGYSAGREESSYEKGGVRGVLGEVDFYTSHEGLMLDYEQALTRESPLPGKSQTIISASGLSTPRGAHSQSPPSITPNGLTVRGGTDTAWYNTSAHFLWIGDRTRQLDGAHVEYFRGIRNPIGVKVGPSMQDDELITLLDVINPDKETGRITLITRYGAGKIENHLSGHIAAVQSSGHPVAWICDPMHGNTLTASTGVKTRHFKTIVSELTSCIRIHAECGSRLNGVSLEFTGEINEEGFSVTECLGGSMELSEEELGLRYQSFCDPRLNFEQSLDVAFLLSEHFKKERRYNPRVGEKGIYSELLGKQAS
ncbi:DAHP synthetase [Punctularia strigosozonata HHB-11173 SS5]|uniref:DAHP synthetase n=1 Tax=Punctularia strigosozonata (strain HHB-11173) TaxID=741275 RepID=UPI00044165B1|nr:DAHP synthetase [Punctularia strigosozonata HHB-11173 SS5]EIN13091.1 DAHP synthetase [Punctularia strigosozonata HHB-11173 SS5]